MILKVLDILRKTLKENLQRLRGNRTQEEMAELAGIPYGSWRNAENGKIPHKRNLAKIAKSLGVSEAELFGEKPKEQAIDLQTILALSAPKREAISLIVSMQDDYVIEALKAIRAYAHDDPIPDVEPQLKRPTKRPKAG